jgi:hypothetical protein
MTRSITRRSALALIVGSISEMNDFVLDESWVFAISSQPSILMSTSRLQGVAPTMHNGYHYDNAWFGA